MIVDFSHIREDKLPDVPVSNKTDVLVRDGRTFADFAMCLAAAQEREFSSDPPGRSELRSNRNPLDLLKQLLR